MGKKGTKGDRKTRSGRHEDEEEEDYMTDVMPEGGSSNHDDATSAMVSTGGIEKIGKNDVQVDLFLDGIDNLDSKKSQARMTALTNIVSSLRSGADLFDRAQSNMDALVASLKRILSHRTSNAEVVSALMLLDLLALVAGAENDAFAEEFTELLINLATKSEIEDVDVRVAAVRSLAFVHLVCCGGEGRGYSCFGVVGDIAMLQSEGTDVCEELQVSGGALIL